MFNKLESGTEVYSNICSISLSTKDYIKQKYNYVLNDDEVNDEIEKEDLKTKHFKKLYI